MVDAIAKRKADIERENLTYDAPYREAAVACW